MKFQKSSLAISLMLLLCISAIGYAAPPISAQGSITDSAKAPSAAPIVNPDSQTPVQSKQTGQSSTEPVKTAQIQMSKARIKFDETDFDFGSIQKGSQVTHNFWFFNEGTDTLIITKVQPTCGCTTTRNKDISVPPNGRSSVDISFNSGRFNGKVTKGIKVECNDSVDPYMELRFSATINNPLQILESSPLEANFKTVTPGKNNTLSMNLTNLDSTLSKLVVVEQPSPQFIKSKIDRPKLKPKQSTKIEFTLSDNILPGPFASSITIEVDKKTDSRITIPILGTISTTSEAGTEATKK